MPDDGKPNTGPDDQVEPNENDQPPDPEGEDGGDDDGPVLKEDGSPFTRTDLAALQEALSKARKEARQAKRGKPDAGASPTGTTTGDQPDPEKVRQEVEQAAAAKWKPQVVRAHARTAFVEAGLVLPKDNQDGAMARVLKLLDLDDLDITDDGQVDGLREQVEDIRRDFPELFATANGRRVARVDGSDRGAPPPKKESTDEKLLRQAGLLVGRR